MPYAGESVMEWLLKKEVARPRVDLPADTDRSCRWIIAAGAGRYLARSQFPSDVLMFNSILKGILFQVFCGLAQAQRYCCFTHNDMHAGNVLLSEIFSKKLFVTGFGAFNIIQPRITIIDFQMASLHTLNAQGEITGFASGGVPSTMSFINAFSLHYDPWRFVTFLAQAGLRGASGAWDATSDETKQFIWKVGQFGTPVGVWPEWSNELQWNPFLHQGMTAEECVMDPYFDSFRSDPYTCADSITIETPDDGYGNAAATERYERRVALCSSPLDVRDVMHGTERKKQLTGKQWAQNTFGTIRSRVTQLKKTHPPAAINRFLYIWTFIILGVMQYAYDVIDEEAPENTKSAGLDALMVSLMGLWNYTDRFDLELYPTATEYYKRSRELCEMDIILNYQKVWPQPLGCIIKPLNAIARRVEEDCTQEYLNILYHEMKV